MPQTVIKNNLRLDRVNDTIIIAISSLSIQLVMWRNHFLTLTALKKHPNHWATLKYTQNILCFTAPQAIDINSRKFTIVFLIEEHQRFNHGTHITPWRVNMGHWNCEVGHFGPEHMHLPWNLTSYVKKLVKGHFFVKIFYKKIIIILYKFYTFYLEKRQCWFFAETKDDYYKQLTFIENRLFYLHSIVHEL